MGIHDAIIIAKNYYFIVIVLQNNVTNMQYVLYKRFKLIIWISLFIYSFTLFVQCENSSLKKQILTCVAKSKYIYKFAEINYAVLLPSEHSACYMYKCLFMPSTLWFVGSIISKCLWQLCCLVSRKKIVFLIKTK